MDPVGIEVKNNLAVGSGTTVRVIQDGDLGFVTVDGNHWTRETGVMLAPSSHDLRLFDYATSSGDVKTQLEYILDKGVSVKGVFEDFEQEDRPVDSDSEADETDDAEFDIGADEQAPTPP